MRSAQCILFTLTPFAIGQISVNVRVELLSVMRTHSVSTLMVASTVTVTLATLEVVILEIAMVY